MNQNYFGLKRNVFCLLILMIVGSIALWLGREVDSTITFLGLVIVWTALVPGLIYLQSENRQPIPFFPLVGIFYAVFFGLPVFLTPFMPKQNGEIVLYAKIVIEKIDINVLLLALSAIVTMEAAYFIVKRWPFRNLAHLKLGSAREPNTLNYLYWLLMLVHFAYEFVPAINSIPSLGQFAGPIIYLAFGGLFLQWRAGNLPNFQLVLFIFAAIPLELALRISNFLITPLLLLFLFAFLLLWRERLYKSLISIVVVGCVVISLYDVTSVLRTRGLELTEIPSVLAKSVLAVTLKGQKVIVLENGRKIHYVGRFLPITHRISQIWVLHAIYEKTPAKIPFWRGETYLPLLTAYIPRILYPDKPLEQTGYKFGMRYGFLNEHNGKNTSVNLPWMTEFFANFGISGVFVGMSLVGLLLAFLDKLFNARGMSNLEFVFGTTLIFPLIYPESNFSVMTGSMLPLFVALFVYFRFGMPLLDRLLSRWP